MTEFINQSEQNTQGNNMNNNYSGQRPPIVPPQGQQYQTKYGFGSQYPENEQRPNNYLAIAIISTVLNLFACCSYYIGFLGLIVGIIAIVFSSQVDSRYRAGDYIGAQSSSKTAKILSYVSLAIALSGIILLIILLFTVGTVAFIDELHRQMKL